MATKNRKTKAHTASRGRIRVRRASKRERASRRPRSKKQIVTTPAAPIPERRKQQPETLRLRAIHPGLTVNDLQASLRFYTEALGFFLGQRWTDESGALRGVMLKAGVCELGLSQDDWAKGRDRNKGQGVRLWLRTEQDIDARAARIQAAGYTLAEPPTDQPWGARTLAVDDPDGYHLTIYRQLGQ